MIESDRFVASTLNEPVEESIERALRPKELQEYVGQEKVRSQLEIFISAAKNRNEALDHVLLFGPPGLGKTTLGTILWATWLFGKDPKAKILIVTKQDQNKKKISQDINNFSWHNLSKEIAKISPQNCYHDFLKIFIDNKNQPLWMIESMAINVLVVV